MATKKKPAKKVAKKSAARRGGGATAKAPPMAAVAPRPEKMAMRVRDGGSTYTARSCGVVASCTTSAWAAARALASKLGYSVSADVRFVGCGADRVQHFEVVELQP